MKLFSHLIITSNLSLALYVHYNIIDTILYDTGLEAPFVHSLHSVYFCKFTPCCLPGLTFEAKLLRKVGKFRPTKLN